MEFKIINPKTKNELLLAIRNENNYRFGAGFTDLLMELKNKTVPELTVINLSQIEDERFNEINISTDELKLGAMVTAHKLGQSELLKRKFPVLHMAALNLASTQIRHVATIGGNICTASPSGDITCALVALEAECEIMGATSKTRTMPIRKFLSGVRQTDLQNKELLYRIHLPANNHGTKQLISDFIKIGTRLSMECSVVSLAYHIQLDDAGVIIKAGIAIGASAPTVQFTESACHFLIGKKFKSVSEKEKKEFAEKVVSYASPISDIRATAWYRREVLFNISKSIFE